MLLYLVVYDIPDDKRRQQVHDLLLGYGQRVQYSVFECVLPANKYDQLQQCLKKMANLQEDNLRFYPVSGHTLGQIETWGVGPKVTEWPSAVIV